MFCSRRHLVRWGACTHIAHYSCAQIMLIYNTVRRGYSGTLLAAMCTPAKSVANPVRNA
jgi:hypothetical protein